MTTIEKATSDFIEKIPESVLIETLQDRVQNSPLLRELLKSWLNPK